MNIENLQNQMKELENKYDKQFDDIFEAIQFLITENGDMDNKKERPIIGYKT